MEHLQNNKNKAFQTILKRVLEFAYPNFYNVQILIEICLLRGPQI